MAEPFGKVELILNNSHARSLHSLEITENSTVVFSCVLCVSSEGGVRCLSNYRAGIMAANHTGSILNPLGMRVSFRHPSAVTWTMSSMRTPPTSGR
jgi:hypothetical protein